MKKPKKTLQTHKARALSLLIAVQMLVSPICFPLPGSAAEPGTSITITTAEEFAALAQSCVLDTFSQGLTVELAADLDLSSVTFSPIPTFGGTFHGNGHTLSGLYIDQKGSYLGLFRYVQKSAKITELTVRGTVTPGGSKSTVGGIVGENAGTLERCTFFGTVEGENVIGGLVGQNTDSGVILSCAVYGSVTGESATGGIVGKSSGLIQNCTNYAAVNTVYEEKNESLANMDADVGAFWENYKSAKDENTDDSLLGHTDTGGIVGYTSGVVRGCVNRAPVGYAHIGYNVGGIAGRQSGYMLTSDNHGHILGRKDVGGIVGQAEPYILLHTNESGLKDIQKELDTLNGLVNTLISGTDTLGDDAEVYLNAISDHAGDAKDYTKAMLDEGTDFVDDNLDELNAWSVILSDTVEKLEPVFESLEETGTDIATSLDTVSAALKELEVEAPELSGEIEAMAAALSSLSLAETDLKKAIDKLEEALDELDSAVRISNTGEVKRAVATLNEAIKDILYYKRVIKEACETIRDTLLSKPDSFEALGINAKAIAENLKLILQSLADSMTDWKKVNESLETILSDTTLELSHLRTASVRIENTFENLENGMKHLTRSLSDCADAVVDLSDAASDYTDEVLDELSKAKDGISDGLASLSEAATALEEAFSDMKAILEELGNEEPLEFVKLGEAFREQSEGLFTSLSDISNDLEQLKDTLSDGTGQMADDLNAVSDQFHVVMNTLIDKVENIENADYSLEDVFEDVSDQNIESTRQGKIAECHNYGSIDADRNTGGIVGAMAIEYSTDPEDELEKPNTLNFTYRTRDVLEACINDGSITGKKDCTGGIVGFAEIGTVYKCESYGTTESTDGNYVGGIAGKSEATVRKSYAKGRAAGKRYVGGLAGKANIVSASFAMVSVTGEESTGALLGEAEALDKLSGNYYVDKLLGGVDGVSYQSKAEPVTYAALSSQAEIPERFTGFTVTFVADNIILGAQSAIYGEAYADLSYPDIPKKEGYFGTWQIPENECVTEDTEIICTYTPLITVLASEEKNEKGKLALALAEGAFTDKAVLHLSHDAASSPVEGGLVYAFTISGSDISETDTVTLHLLNRNGKKARIYQRLDTEWVELDVTVRGKYFVTEVTGSTGVLCVANTGNSWHVLPILTGGIAVVVLVFIAIRKRKKKKKKGGVPKAPTARQKEPGTIGHDS